MNIGRIFIGPENYRKGYGVFLMQDLDKVKMTEYAVEYKGFKGCLD